MEKEPTKWELLKAEFPTEKISWRASHMNAEGTSALALAYIDARDTMNRLDEVFGPENWKDSYHVVGVTTMCTLEIKIDGEWVSKTDGAGVSDIEAEKGAISDAFKRAGVKWGIGRYLYDLKSPWVPCESYMSGGKPKFKKFTADPWECMKETPKTAPKAAPRTKALVQDAGVQDYSTDPTSDDEFWKSQGIGETPANHKGIGQTPESHTGTGPAMKQCATCVNHFEIKPGKEWATTCFDCWKKANPIKK